MPGKRFRGERVEGLIGSIHCGGRSVCGKILGEVGGNNGRVKSKPILPGDTNHHLPRLGQFFAIIGSVRIAVSMALDVYFHFGTGKRNPFLKTVSRLAHARGVPISMLFPADFAHWLRGARGGELGWKWRAGG